MEQFYQVYGLQVRTSQPLPGLMPADSPDAVDLCIDLDKSCFSRFQSFPKKLWYASDKDRYGNFAHVWILAEGEYYQFRYNDGASFVIDRSGTRIWAWWPSALSIEDIVTYLTGHILGFTLGLRGRLCLHASAVAIDGHAVALMAPGGGGKSTTAAVFAHLGFPVITDDVLVLLPRTDGFMVQPGYPRINLWPASIPAIAEVSKDLPRIVPDSASYPKRYLDLIDGWDRFQSMPVPLTAIYTGDSIDHSNQPFVTSVSARDAMIALAAQLYRFPLIERTDLIKEFELLARIASRIPLRLVTFRRELGRIAALCQAILADFRSLQPSRTETPTAVHETFV